jgi:hypothetical protein
MRKRAASIAAALEIDGRTNSLAEQHESSNLQIVRLGRITLGQSLQVEVVCNINRFDRRKYGHEMIQPASPSLVW